MATGDIGALADLARLVFEREAAALADIDARIAALRADLDAAPDTPRPPADATAAALAQGALWQDWRRARRAADLRALAQLSADRLPLHAAAARAFGRWQVLHRLAVEGAGARGARVGR